MEKASTEYSYSYSYTRLLNDLFSVMAWMAAVKRASVEHETTLELSYRNNEIDVQNCYRAFSLSTAVSFTARQSLPCTCPQSATVGYSRLQSASFSANVSTSFKRHSTSWSQAVMGNGRSLYSHVRDVL